MAASLPCPGPAPISAQGCARARNWPSPPGPTIAGRPVELLVRDSKSDPSVAQQQAASLQSEGVSGLLCSSLSSEGAALSAAARAGRMPVPDVMASAVADEITGKSCNQWTFRSVPSATTIAHAVARFTAAQPTLSAGGFYILGSDYLYGRSSGRAFSEIPGIKIVGESYAPLDTADWTPYLNKVSQSGATGLWLPVALGSPYVQLMVAANAMKLLQHTTVMAPTGLPQELVDQLGEAAVGVVEPASAVLMTQPRLRPGRRRIPRQIRPRAQRGGAAILCRDQHHAAGGRRGEGHLAGCRARCVAGRQLRHDRGPGALPQGRSASDRARLVGAGREAGDAGRRLLLRLRRRAGVRGGRRDADGRADGLRAALMQTAALAVVSGLLYGCTLLLVAVGLTLIFGVGRVVNFAHGTLYALGAFLGASIHAVAGLWVACLLAPALVAVVAVALDLLVIRRLRRRGEMVVLLFTFGLGIVIDAAITGIWGARSYAVAVPDLLAGGVPLVRRAGLRLLDRAGGQFARGDRAAGRRPARHRLRPAPARGGREPGHGGNRRRSTWTSAFTAVLAVGSAFAALAGVLVLPMVGASNGMDLTVTVLVFIVVIVGGLGSLPGTARRIAAGGRDPDARGHIRLLGRLPAPVRRGDRHPAGAAVRAGAEPQRMSRAAALAPGAVRTAKPGLWATILFGVVLLAAALAPLLLPPFTVHLLALVLCYGTWAMSFGLVMGQLGLTSFGHAALFGGGAYAAAWVGLNLSDNLLAGLGVAGLFGAMLGAVLGLVLGRLSGVAFSIGSLAFGGMVAQVANSWAEVTGGSDGLVGLPFPRLLGRDLDDVALYGAAAVLACATFCGIDRGAAAPPGPGAACGAG